MERLESKPNIFAQDNQEVVDAKPEVIEEKPERRNHPLFPSPLPERRRVITPSPAPAVPNEPVRAPHEPVPAKR